MMAPAMSYTPRGVSSVHAKRRREWLARLMRRVTVALVLDCLIVALAIGVIALFSLLGWLIHLG